MIGPAMDTAFLPDISPGWWCRRSSAAIPGSRCCDEQDAPWCAGAGDHGGPGWHLQHRRRRHHHDVPGDPPGWRLLAGAHLRPSGRRPLRKARLNSEVTADQLDYLWLRLVMDTTCMRTELGFEPKWTTLECVLTTSVCRGLTPHRRPGLAARRSVGACTRAQRRGRSA